MKFSCPMSLCIALAVVLLASCGEKPIGTELPGGTIVTSPDILSEKDREEAIAGIVLATNETRATGSLMAIRVSQIKYHKTNKHYAADLASLIQAGLPDDIATGSGA